MSGQPPPSIEAIRACVAADLSAVDALIARRLASDVALINQLSGYIIHSGGKRLRPLLVLLAARACGYQGETHWQLAAIVEFIHTATLLHDDVVDGSLLRRGQDTANARWGNEASVLVGDFLYSRAFQLMVETGSLEVMRVMADATNTIAEGEVLQLLNCHDPETTEARYLEVIHRKTARLFEAAGALGAIIAGRDAATVAALAAYGRHMGAAFQLIDDALDYRGDAQATGKNLGDDLAEGKPTLPLIHALRHASPPQAALLREVIERGGRERIGEVLAAIEATGAIAYTCQLARREGELAAQAIAGLNASPFRQAMQLLASFAVDRTY